MTVPAVRGGIYDRNGEVLAESVTKQTVVADPLLITHPAAHGRCPGPGARDCPPTKLRAELTEHSGFVYLAHRVSDSRGGQGHRPRPDRHQPGARAPAGPARRPAGPPGGGDGQLGRRRGLGAGVPVPVAPGRQGRLQEPHAGPRRGDPPRNGQGSVAAQPGDRAGADHRRVGPVRGRAGPGRRDLGVPRLQRHGRGHGREDRRHPGHGRPPGHHRLGHHRGESVGDGRSGDGGRLPRARPTSRRRVPPWCRRPTPCPPGWRRLPPTPP